MGRVDDKGTKGHNFDRAGPGEPQTDPSLSTSRIGPAAERVCYPKEAPVIIVIYVSRVFYRSLGKI